MRFLKPSAEELLPLVAEATKAQTAVKWAAKLLATIARILRTEPLRYRAYGPYWWPLKQRLIEAGYQEFGEFVDAEWLADAGYGDLSLDLAASWAYADVTVDRGQRNWPYHALTNEADEDIEFVSADEEMEMMAVLPSFR